jgi:hypothetical protein
MSRIKELFNLFEKEVGKEVFDVRFFNVSQDEGMDIMVPIFYTEDEAMEFAKKELENFKDDEDVIEATLFCGEYEDEQGNVFGDPVDFFTISAKSKEETMAAREKGGYAVKEVNAYLQ